MSAPTVRLVEDDIQQSNLFAEILRRSPMALVAEIKHWLLERGRRAP